MNSSPLYFIATREPVTWPQGTYKTLAVVKVEDGVAAYIAAATPGIARTILDAMKPPHHYEFVESAALGNEYYLRDCPFRILLIGDEKTAHAWLADRLNFPYAGHLNTVENLNPLRLAR
ncbi:MAG: hypothetical protein JWN73_3359 [Betaproteobacteria bacterium]|nr:hypothetical protein [Betaproteobacteria bacterium]